MRAQTIKPTKISEVKRSWHLVDVGGKVLGRVAQDIAQKLAGKRKTNFVRYLDCGDYVVVINAKNVVVTGRKEKEKTYGHFSGYPGGLKEKPLWLVRQEHPDRIIKQAIMGMLPKNKLRKRLITRLHIYKDAVHPYGKKFETVVKKG